MQPVATEDPPESKPEPIIITKEILAFVEHLLEDEPTPEMCQARLLAAERGFLIN